MHIFQIRSTLTAAYGPEQVQASNLFLFAGLSVVARSDPSASTGIAVITACRI